LKDKGSKVTPQGGDKKKFIITLQKSVAIHRTVY
jgi:hypothetical protein